MIGSDKERTFSEKVKFRVGGGFGENGMAGSDSQRNV